MKLANKRVLACGLLCACVLASLVAPAANARQAPKSAVMKALGEELQRAREILGKKGNPPPYFMSYQVADVDFNLISASYGALRVNTSSRFRLLDVDVRVGDYRLDSTHRIRGDAAAPAYFGGYSQPVSLPIEDDVDALKSVVWLKTDEKYKEAVERLIHVQTNRAVKVEEEDKSADFSREAPQVVSLPTAGLRLNAAEWGKKVRELSAVFTKYPEIYSSAILLTEEAHNKYLVNTEGAALQHGRSQVSLIVVAATKADDGMDLFRYETFQASTPEGLPADEVLRQGVEKVSSDLLALRKAPVIEPYTGPAILTGRASGVFFHEIFGHRIEGNRQKDEEEGSTFTKRLNLPVLPPFLSVYDDPTLERYAGVELNGFYPFDDEGVKAQRVTVVQNGVLKNFLMSRSPVLGFEKSNGHGRKFPGFAPVGRQGNLIVQAARTVPRARLRQMLIAESRRQRKRFGLLFEDVFGGFTTTGRATPQAFQITPVMVYKVYTDGRPDELVRGVDIIGTPLVSFSKIIASDDQPEIFNGACGAESGMVPVSAVAPGILTAQIEVQKRQKSPELPPILPPPAFDRGEAERRTKGNQ